MIPSMQGGTGGGGFLGGVPNDEEDDDNDVGIPMDDDDDDDNDADNDDGDETGDGREDDAEAEASASAEAEDDDDDDGLDEILRRVEREDVDEEEDELRYYGYKPSKFRKLQRPAICEGRGRSIVHVLADRARLGSHSTAFWRAGWAWKDDEDDDEEDEEDDDEEEGRLQEEEFLESSSGRRRAVTGAEEAQLEDVGEGRTVVLPERLKLNAPPLSIRHEMGYFAEYHSVIQCRSAYLHHLGGERNQGAMTPLPNGTPRNPKQRARHRQQLLRHVTESSRPGAGPPTGFRSTGSISGAGFSRRPPPPRQPPAPPTSAASSAAVSTISVAFSPDGRTLASTHGDHTVKITCCHTGHLIRALEGHPRTPWTVKYHPSKPNIVASGCLGYQVRIWDWNFKNRKDARATNTARRRTQSSAHFFDGAGTRQPRRRPPFWADEEVPQEDSRRARQRRRRPPHHSRRESPRGVVQYDYDNGSKTLARLMPGGAGTTARSTGGMDTWITAVREDAEQYDYREGMGVCLHMIRLSFAIISLSFHPSGLILAIASGSTLHLWDYADVGNKEKMAAAAAAAASSSMETTEDDNWQRQRRAAAANRPPAPPQNNARQGASSTSSRGTVTEWRHDHPLRCVHFPPLGDTLIVGGANPPSGGGGGMSGGGMSFSLTLYNFDLDAALHPHLEFRDSQIPRDVITRPRTFVHRALLYNDGGFDVSPDGKTLCACAEYWLPEGVNNAMELFAQGTDDYLEEEEDGDAQSHVVPPRREHDPLGLEISDELVTEVNAAVGDDANPNGATSEDDIVPSTEPVETLAASQRSLGGRANDDDDEDDKELEDDDGFQSPPRDPLDLEVAASALDPRTPPPDADQPRMSISPPPPPGRRWPGGLLRRTDTKTTRTSSASTNSSGVTRGGSAAAAVAARLQGGRTQTPGRSAASDARRNYLHPNVLTTYLERERRSFEPVGTGRFVPHVVTVNLDTSAEPSPPRPNREFELEGYEEDDDVDINDDDANSPPSTQREQHVPGPQLGQVMEASPLDGPKASGVTCVKFSPSAEFCLLGYGVRETPATAPPPARRRQLGGRQDRKQRRQRRRKGCRGENSEGAEEDDDEEDDEEEGDDFQDEEEDESALYHPVTAIYRIRGGMTHVSTMLSGEDDVNIARFHPDVGYGMVYGTKQGRVRVLGPRPWNYYHC